jgi:P27 family predicted phage terminase small subunit
VQQLPHVSISQTYQKIMNRCAEQLGLTPSSRSRLIAGEPGGSIKDDMEELLGGG